MNENNRNYNYASDVDYRKIDTWDCEREKLITTSSGLYSIWESIESSQCLYVGKARNISSRVKTFNHPWQVAKKLYDQPVLRCAIVIGDERELSLQECLAIGQLRPLWNFAQKPEIQECAVKTNQTNDIIRIHRRVSQEAWDLYIHFFDGIENAQVSLELIEAEYPAKTPEHIKHLLGQLKAADLISEEVES